MKWIDIALKDMLHSFRSAFSLVMMFVAPLLMTLLMSLAFGGGDDGGVSLPTIHVQVVNLDQPSAVSGSWAMGDMLLDVLKSEGLADILAVREAPDEATARAAVDAREAGVAVVIPANLTANALGGTGDATVVIYQDPTLTIGPSLVKTLISGVLDGFSGSRIAAQVTSVQFEARGQVLDAATENRLVRAYGEWARAQGELLRDNRQPYFHIQHPPSKARAADQRAAMMGQVMVGMMIFFAFFTGTSAAESILREDEEGTLARLFTTPTPQRVILGGKLLAVFVTVLVQVIILLTAARLAFGINWGRPIPAVLATLALVAAAAGFGVFLMSLVRTTRQSGPVIGVVVTLTGMLGGLMTTGVPDLPRAFQIGSLFTPQGWVLKTWKLALLGGSAVEVLIPSMVAAAIGVLLFLIGSRLIGRRFA